MKFLDPQYIDRIDVPDAMKLEFILAGKEQLLKFFNDFRRNTIDDKSPLSTQNVADIFLSVNLPDCTAATDRPCI